MRSRSRRDVWRQQLSLWCCRLLCIFRANPLTHDRATSARLSAHDRGKWRMSPCLEYGKITTYFVTGDDINSPTPDLPLEPILPAWWNTLARIGPAVRADFRRLYPANAKTPTCCPSDDNRTKVTNSVTSARSLWWHVGLYFWPADLTRTANPIKRRLYSFSDFTRWDVSGVSF